MIKHIIFGINLLATFAYNNMTIDEVVDTNPPSLLGLDSKAYFDELLKLPDTLIQDIIDLNNLKPPVKLQTLTKVQTPPAAQVERHWSHAKFSYCVFSKLVDFKCVIGCPDYKVTKTFEHAGYGTFALVGYESTTKEIIISHRGTSNIRNWLRDFSYGKARMPNTPEDVLVHEGFLGVYNSNAANINAYLMSMLDDPKFQGYKVVFTGHSLGGAVATLHTVDMAAKVKAKGFPVELYAYHAPRAGNQAFVDHAIGLNFTIARYTNKGDIVSHAAPRQFGFVHVPGEFHTDFTDLLGKSFRQCSQDYDEDPNCGWKELKNIWLLDHTYGFGKIVNFIC